MFVAAIEFSQKLSEADEQIQKSVNLRQYRFGRSSEKGLTSEEDGYSHLCFAFNEAEMAIDRNPAFPEPKLGISSRNHTNVEKRKQEDVRKRAKMFR